MQIREARPDDLDAIFELLTARSRAAFGVSQVQREFVAADFKIAGTDQWVAVGDEAVVGYATLTSAQDLTHAARDPVVGDALLERAEECARERGFDFVAVTAVPEDVPLWALVERSGFAHERDILRMWRRLNGDLPQPAWPDDVDVRTYADDDAQRVQTLLDTVYSAWDTKYVARPHADWLAFMTEHDDFDPAMWFLVERDGELLACALQWKKHQRRGWVKDIVVRESERGRGLGKALLHHGFREYAARGVDRVGLKVDSTNPTGAPQLYERVGFETDQKLGIWIKRL